MATKKKTESAIKKNTETAKKQGSEPNTVQKKTNLKSQSGSSSKSKTNKSTSTKKTVTNVKATEKKQSHSPKKGSTDNQKTKTKQEKAVSIKKTNSTSTKTKKTSSSRPKKEERVFPTSKWGSDSKLSFEITDQLPPPELTSIAGGFVFYDDKLILANIPGRGWEIIGGRIDVEEDPEATFKREAMNQIGVELEQVKMIGVVKIEHMGPEPPNCPYPFPIGYAVQYVGIAKDMRKFYGSSDSLGRSAITPEGFREHYYEWNEYYDAVFKYAYEVYQKMKKKLKR